MMSERNTERTPLITTKQTPPDYVYRTNIYNRQRKRRVLRFQFCICVVLISAFVTTVVIGVSYMINKNDAIDLNNSTTSNNSLLLLLSVSWPLKDDNIIKVINNTNKNKWKYALDAGESALKEKDQLEIITPSLSINEPSFKHQKVFSSTNKTRQLARVGYLQQHAIQHFINLSNNNQGIKICNNSHDFALNYCNNHQPNFCIQKYRSYDGYCNNVYKPTIFGVAFTPFRRSLLPQYADGISMPRLSKNGRLLPPARTVSLEVHRPFYRNDYNFTVMLAVWGQFLDHDITETAPSRGLNGKTISCCGKILKKHPECYPVYLEHDDPFFKYNNVTCMEFIRSAPAPNCCLGPREQMNQVSSYLDGSVIYGSDDITVNKLRTFINGTLKMFFTKDNRTLLPISDDPYDGCNREEENKKGKYCFMAGDSRANENLHLTSMHLLWARQHNFIAKKLSKLNPKWNDEHIFQETRKIIGAQMQHITYNEFLPILLGSNIMEEFDLNPNNKTNFNNYDPNIDPSVANNFATAAFRFAHTLIPGLIKFLIKNSSNIEYIQLRKMLFNPYILYEPQEFDRTLKSAMETNIEASDPYFTDELKQHLFEQNYDNKNNLKKCGLDLVSLNIQRGRDHGLPGYTKWRKYCGLRIPNNFDDLIDDIDFESFKNIKAIYNDVDDIDLYTGGLSEKPLNNNILGPTMTCLILDQFIRLKKGDRFWYETNEKPQGFTKEQIKEIKKTTLANIICDNADNIKYIQPKVMMHKEKNNDYIHCGKIQRIKLTPWKDYNDFPHISISPSSLFITYINHNNSKSFN